MATRKIHVFRDEAVVNTVPTSTAVLGKSFVTTNISTVTIDDKENLDPVTGLPLSTLLLKLTDNDGKPTSFKPPTKYIATTIITTVISPVSDPPTATTASPSRSKAESLHQMKKSRVALGTKVAPGMAAASASNSNRTSASPRTGRLGYISAGAKSKASAMNRGSGSPIASSKAKGSAVAVKAKRTKKLVIAKHAATVAAVAAADSGSNGGNVDEDKFVMEGVQHEPHDAGNDLHAAACVQRIVNQRCRDLTVRPLANVSEAYGASSSDDDRY